MFAPPVLLFLLGATIGWVLRGFARPPADVVVKISGSELAGSGHQRAEFLFGSARANRARAHATACPQLVEADIRPPGGNSGFEPIPEVKCAPQQLTIRTLADLTR